MEFAEWLWHCLWPLGSSSDFSEPQLCICKKTDLVILKLSLNSENVWFGKTAFKEYLNTPPPTSTAPQTILLDQFQRPNVNKNILFPTSISSETGFFRLSNNGKGGLQYLATTKKKIIIVLNQQMLCSPLDRSWLFLGKGKCNKEWCKNSRGRHNHNQREQKQNPGITTSECQEVLRQSENERQSGGNRHFQTVFGKLQVKMVYISSQHPLPDKGWCSSFLGTFWNISSSGTLPRRERTVPGETDLQQAGRQAGRRGLVHEGSPVRGLVGSED